MIARTAFLVVLACLVATGCDKDPAQSMKIATRPPAAASGAVAASASATTAPREAEVVAVTKADLSPPAASSAARRPAPATSAAPSKAEWRPPGCPPPPEGGQAGPSTLVVTGSCAFQHQGKFNCEALGDDFYVSMTRKAAQGATLMVYINVEEYKGPGEYKRAQVFVGIQDKTNIYRWSNDTVALTVGKDQAYAVLPKTRLEAEPLLVDCSGAMDNYQCSGRGQHEQLLATAVDISGKLQCEASVKKAKQ